MSWLSSIDLSLFRFVNQTVSNPFLDRVMPWFSGNAIFLPAVALFALGLIWKGGLRGRIFALVLLSVFAFGDAFVISTLKRAIARPRPFLEHTATARLLVGEGASGSMPSSHTSTWFAVTFIAYIYYRRSWRVVLPVACLVGLSRIYVGAHYPSDVLVGAIIGSGYAAAGLSAWQGLWSAIGARWFRPIWQRMPSILNPTLATGPGITREQKESMYLAAGRLFIGAMLLSKLIYIASGVIQLSEDEAYQWLWSKHLALSYYSKPPMIAYAQFFGTHLWGDNAFGVRFLAPVLAASVSWMMLHFLARHWSARAGFWLALLMNCTPLLAVGSTLLTIDPLLVMFWMASQVTGWKAVQPNGTTRDWAWVGLWTGLAFLSKYSALYLIVCWMFFFLLWPPARLHLKKIGPWLALAILACSSIPVLIWNSQHEWITVEHVASHANLGSTWTWAQAKRYFVDFTGGQALLLNPFLFLAGIWAMSAIWRKRDPLLTFFFCMGPLVFLGHWLYSLHSRIQPNWVAPSVLPMLCLTVAYWERRVSSYKFPVSNEGGSKRPASEQARENRPIFVSPVLKCALVFGLVMLALLHDTNLVTKIFGRPLPALKDPLRRVRAWSDTAAVAGEARKKLLAEGKPVFIIADHYGLVGHISFYLPEARAQVKNDTFVYYQSSPRPQNQFYFWPGYLNHRRGQNAIFIREVDGPDLPADWLKRWLEGGKALDGIMDTTTETHPPPAPKELISEFDSVEDLGVRKIIYRDRVFRYVQTFACRNLR